MKQTYQQWLDNRYWVLRVLARDKYSNVYFHHYGFEQWPAVNEGRAWIERLRSQ